MENLLKSSFKQTQNIKTCLHILYNKLIFTSLALLEPRQTRSMDYFKLVKVFRNRKVPLSLNKDLCLLGYDPLKPGELLHKQAC